MSEFKEKGKREWVKTAAIIFLAVMLVLTFFSNTIMNYSLPEVETSYVYSGTITALVRGTGTVKAKDPFYVKATDSRLIESVVIAEGDYVAEGDPLFYFSSKDSGEIEAAKTELETAEKALEDLEKAYKLNFLSDSNTEALVDAKEGTVESNSDLDARVNEALAQKLTCENEIDRLNGLLPALNRQLEIYDSQGTQYANDLSLATTALATAAADKAAADLIPDPVASAAAQVDMDQAQADMDTAQANIDALPQLKININNQISQINYEISLQNINIKTLNEILSEVNEKYEIKDAYQEIVDQKKVVQTAKDALLALQEENGGTVVTAKVSGKVSSVGVVAGDTTVPNGDLATIQIDGKGFTLEFSVTKQQASRLTIGDEASLVNNWYYQNVRLVLSKIKTDPTNPSSNNILVFDVTGDELAGGENLNVAIGQRSANYDMIVPNSAIHEDNDGTFVYRIESKASPLSTRYYARREKVEVLASDDTQSAISATFDGYGYGYIITNSTLPIEDNQLVRITDN